MTRIRNELRLQTHELPEFLRFTAADRHFKVQIAQPQQIGIVEPRNNFLDFAEINDVGAVTAKKCSCGRRAWKSLMLSAIVYSPLFVITLVLFSRAAA